MKNKILYAIVLTEMILAGSIMCYFAWLGELIKALMFFVFFILFSISTLHFD